MSVTISTCQQICHSPTNVSPSKMLFSFPKTSRFSNNKAPLCDRYYDLPSTASSCRTTTLGYGNKYDFKQDAPKNPSPDTYNIQSSFAFNKTQGFGFGKGRQEMEVTGPLALAKSNKNPGPGQYKLSTTLSQTTFSFTGKVHEQNKEKMRIPGPGTYPVTFCINQKGTYFYSKYKNSCVRNFSKVQGRHDKNQNKVPGPGAYNSSKIQLSPDGKYTISRMRNCLTRKFAITTRKPLADRSDVPGPGNYKLPSEFGHYMAKKAVDQMKPQKSIKTESNQAPVSPKPKA